MADTDTLRPLHLHVNGRDHALALDPRTTLLTRCGSTWG